MPFVVLANAHARTMVTKFAAEGLRAMRSRFDVRLTAADRRLRSRDHRSSLRYRLLDVGGDILVDELHPEDIVPE